MSQFAGGGSGGAMVFVQKQTASSSASLVFLLPSGYTVFFIVLDGIEPGTNANFLKIQVSTNGGVSFQSSGYSSGVWGVNDNGTAGSFTADGSGIVMNEHDASTSPSLSGIAYVYPVTGNAITWVTDGDTTVPNIAVWSGGGSSGASNVNAIQFIYTTGTIASGTITLYGIK